MSISETFSQHDALGLAELVRNGETTPSELVEEAIRRIEELNPKLNAVSIKLYDLGREMVAGDLPSGPFTGVPFLLKDLVFLCTGVPLTNGTRYLKDFVADTDSAMIARIKRAGLVLIGKTNVPENGYSASTEPVLFGPTHNPWNDAVCAGGSSGGSASAVAGGIVPMADASDGGGSIRIPASNNGLVGLKPSRGRVTWGPQYTDLWYGAAVSLCVSRSVRDTAAFLDAVEGALPGEPYALPSPEQAYLEQLDVPLGRLRIGLVATMPDGSPLSADAAAAVATAGRLCEQLGHHVEEATLRYVLPAPEIARMTATISSGGFEAAEALVGRPVTEDDVEPITWRVIELGRSLTAIQHANDIEALRLFGRDMVEQLGDYDVTITPTQPEPPPPLGTYDMSLDDLERYNEPLMHAMTFTMPFNLSGQPAVTVPLHWTADGLPLGSQLVGRIGDEATILGLARQLEEASPWASRRPPRSI